MRIVFSGAFFELCADIICGINSTVDSAIRERASKQEPGSPKVRLVRQQLQSSWRWRRGNAKDGASKDATTRPTKIPLRRRDKRSSCCRSVMGVVVFVGFGWVSFRVGWWARWASDCKEGCYEKAIATGADGPEQVCMVLCCCYRYSTEPPAFRGFGESSLKYASVYRRICLVDLLLSCLYVECLNV